MDVYAARQILNKINIAVKLLSAAVGSQPPLQSLCKELFPLQHCPPTTALNIFLSLNIFLELNIFFSRLLSISFLLNRQKRKTTSRCDRKNDHKNTAEYIHSESVLILYSLVIESEKIPATSYGFFTHLYSTGFLDNFIYILIKYKYKTDFSF